MQISQPPNVIIMRNYPFILALCILISLTGLAQKKFSAKLLAGVIEERALPGQKIAGFSAMRSHAGEQGAQQAQTKQKANVKFGKYGCTASKYSGGQYTYIPKGTFELKKGGIYTYNGFDKPSTGKFSVDASGVISFKQGYLNDGKATPIEGYENRYYLVFPTIPDGRWTCSLKAAE